MPDITGQATEPLESAVCPHLRTARTCPASLPSADWAPPFPAFSSVFDTSQTELVLAIIGAQSHSGSLDHDALDPLVALLMANPPFKWDMATALDARGNENRAVLAYWRSKEDFAAWRAGFDRWWNDAAREHDPHGWFLEVLSPTIERVETVVAPSVGEGATALGGISGPIREHGYWGGSRDRIPASQTDRLVGVPWRPSNKEKDGLCPRTRVPGVRNLCGIRSGQDWGATTEDERTLYLTSLAPKLEAGMAFLRDHGDKVGCFSCRLMTVVDDDLEREDRTFGLAYFDDLSSLEEWTRTHPTHLAIYHRFLKYVEERNFDVALKLYHEVFVLSEDQQIFEYIRCHPQTGMLASLV